MKRYFSGTNFGRILMDFSHWKRLKSLSIGNPEQAAFFANMAIADKLIVSLCPTGGCFVDVGAHLGLIFATARLKDPKLKVIAFEADPAKAAFLTSKFAYAEVHGNAVGEQSGSVTFFLDDDSSAYNSIVKSSVRLQHSISVEMVTLDSVLQDTPVDTLKIDVEGAELGVLSGAEQTIASHAPTIMLESTATSQNALGYAPEGIWRWLTTRDYQLFYPDRLAHDAPPLKLDAFLDAHEYPRRTDNYFAVHARKRRDVRDRARHILGIN